ncbi:aminotransferase class I/II-fold pyridoxal phosphate-dependent enzyme, partial [Planktomarina temperata]|nr:aminotransferase class I/II-fold pyridoxal phosphate-dependent enzyme [Planktomarina temperata]
KFWGLAGLRLGFAIGDPELIDTLRQRLGPWPVSGIALKIGAAALGDTTWAEQTRARLTEDAERLDRLMRRQNARPMGACALFRTYEVADARQLQHHLAQHKIWTRVFPYSPTWIRLGLPPQAQWARLEAAL